MSSTIQTTIPLKPIDISQQVPITDEYKLLEMKRVGENLRLRVSYLGSANDTFSAHIDQSILNKKEWVGDYAVVWLSRHSENWSRQSIVKILEINLPHPLNHSEMTVHLFKKISPLDCHILSSLNGSSYHNEL